MKKFCQNHNVTFHKALAFGLFMNALCLLLRDALPVVYAPVLCLGQGFAIGLMSIGLICMKPERAEALRRWKHKHLPFLFR